MLQGSGWLGGLGMAGLAGCASAPASRLRAELAGGFPYNPVPSLAPVRARKDRIFDVTVCLRPFRAAGPRLETEQIADTLVVHNYGHGGSGWSLSWGSSTLAVQMAMVRSPREVAVLGCGALGLTSGILAQRAGARVTIYARELLPQTRSARATGSWTPDSRISLSSTAGPAFATRWEEMARTSFKAYRNYLGLPGTPVEWIDHYTVSDTPPDAPSPNALTSGAPSSGAPNALDFASYRSSIRDLTPRPERLAPGVAPFSEPYVTRGEIMIFNLADYGATLMSEFREAGGQVQRAEFHAPGELAALPEKVVINCPGYGGRALWGDGSLTPVRGQIGWLIPQPEVNWALYHKDVSIIPRRDGIVVQALAGGDMKGYGSADETPQRSETDQAVDAVAPLYDRLARRRSARTQLMRRGTGETAEFA